MNRAIQENGQGELPESLLYATSARLGASGLGTSSYESVRASWREGFLGKVLTFGSEQEEIQGRKIKSLQANPVRLLSWMDRKYYHTLKKRVLDKSAARELESGGYDCFHGWSSEAVHSLRMAKRLGIPSLLDIPTWHRDKGKVKPRETMTERKMRTGDWKQRLRHYLSVPRQQVLEEYDLADVILVLSEKARETFLEVGFDESRLFYLGRGVDVERYQIGKAPDIFRLTFVGSVIKRKGAHHLLNVWKKLGLKNAELVLVGNVGEELESYIPEMAGANVRLVGFSDRVEDWLMKSSAFVLPSECEGSAKVTYEAAACGLPQITTRESGDVVQDGLNGRIIQPNDPEGLAEAILEFYSNPEKIREMGLRGRERVVNEFTWDHYRARLLNAYRYAVSGGKK